MNNSRLQAVERRLTINMAGYMMPRGDTSYIGYTRVCAAVQGVVFRPFRQELGI